MLKQAGGNTKFSYYYLFNLFKFYMKQQFNMLSTGWCSLFEIFHSVKREVSCKSQVLSIAFFLYNGIVLLAFYLSRWGIMVTGICNLEFTLKSLNL